MQVTNNPADIVTDKEMEYLRDANERQARQFVAIIAERLGRHGVNLVCNALDMECQLKAEMVRVSEEFPRIISAPRDSCPC